ncbi:uncharacterized protein LOC131850034 [Achroia grisella]|uniref:uncharacterized protein LOC131850034 n=1 Tax=Achroia grisella TaxID=688607 RepID=UPI0027D30CEA|nr:uncharacterized protein LOC131850034 [Achroia grisella]
MYENDVFIFGSKTLLATFTRDIVSLLPLELSWEIFSYLDDTSLRNATKAYETWYRIIIANKKLRYRLNFFELVIKTGSENLAKFYRRNKRLLNKKKSRNYLASGECAVQTTKSTIYRKRSGDELVIYTKRYKLF